MFFNSSSFRFCVWKKNDDDEDDDADIVDWDDDYVLYVLLWLQKRCDWVWEYDDPKKRDI